MRRGQRVLFGRVPSCDVVLEHLSISRQHAVVTVDGTGCAFVMDLQSGERGGMQEMQEMQISAVSEYLSWLGSLY